MKIRFIAASAVVLALTGSSVVASDTVDMTDASKPVRMIFAPSDTFIPVGFDDNDKTEVIIYGEFPNTCYRVGPVQASINETRKEVRIVNEAYYYPGGWCSDVPVPFTIPVDLGILAIGDYKINVQVGANVHIGVGTLIVAPNKSPNPNSPDDYLYAPVQDAVVDASAGAAPVLTLRGTLKNTCWSVSEVRLLSQEKGRVTVAMPIVTVAGTNCRGARIPFEVKKPLENLPKGRSLLHVRTLSGGSLNQVLEF